MSDTTRKQVISISELQSLIEYCRKLLSYTIRLKNFAGTNEAHDLAESLHKSIRKLVIASLMSNKTMVCISGMQGAGKTTLLRNFYGLDDKYLPGTLGRGERVPILITECDADSPKLYEVRLSAEGSQEYILQKNEIPAEEYDKKSKGEDDKTMYLELCVPYKHFKCEAVSLMLLPGYEGNRPPRDYWNTLIEFSVNSCDAAVFVVNSNILADSSNEEYLNKIEEKFGKKVVYAITRSDSSSDDNFEAKKTCMELMDVPQAQSDRVVCVGSYGSENANSTWINEFTSALDKYAINGATIQKNLLYIRDEVDVILDGLSTIQRILDEDNTGAIANIENSDLLDEFDEACRKQKNHFTEKLDQAYIEAKKESIDALMDSFDKRGFGEIKRSLFGADIKSIKKAREKIEASLKDEDGFSRPNRHLVSALKATLIALDTPIEGRKNDLGRLVEVSESNGKKNLLVNSEKSLALKNDICTILADASTSTMLEPLVGKNHKMLMRGVAEVSSYYYALTTCDCVADNEGLSLYTPAQSELVPDDIIESAKSSKSFVAGLAGVMGVDLLGDGVLNFIPQIAASVGVAAPVAAVAAGLIVGGGAAIAIMRDVNRMQRADLQSACNALDSVYDNMKEKVLGNYDQYMGMVRQRIEDNLYALSGKSGHAVNTYSALVEVNNALEMLYTIRDKIEGETGGILSALSR